MTQAVETDLVALGEDSGSVSTVSNIILSHYLSAPIVTLNTTIAKATAITAQPEVVVIETEGVPIATNQAILFSP